MTHVVPRRHRRQHINAELVPVMEQPRIHDSKRFGTKHPYTPGQHYVTASIVGEDGKPYLPRKQWGIDEVPETFRSPFARFIHPPAVGSSADVVNKDPNTALTSIERKSIDSIQLRLKRVLDKLGANIVWDHTSIKNRRLIAEFEALKVESRTLMEEYELRTGVKTIAWQLNEPDQRGLHVPNGQVTDIHFAEHPELASRLLQRHNTHPGPPKLTEVQLAALQAEHDVASGKLTRDKPKEQRVSVRWKRDDATGLVKAKVNLHVRDSKVPAPDAPANLAARSPVPGKLYPSGRTGSPSLPVQIDVVAPANEELFRRNKNGAQAEPPAAAPATALAELSNEQEEPEINL